MSVPFNQVLTLDLDRILHATQARTVQTTWVRGGLCIYELKKQRVGFVPVGNATMLVNSSGGLARFVAFLHFSNNMLPPNVMCLQITSYIDMTLASIHDAGWNKMALAYFQDWKAWLK